MNRTTTPEPRKRPMTPADARRIQSSTDRKPNAGTAAQGFKQRAMRAAETTKKR